ncbi:hypothetical protein BJ878DRAFT_167855 [Calycina marina]|uniref:Uncharacterized protein n=1 Tax=Calycina marina TaxID=1763456 RepID=A0A9P8CDD2_9HELO|nr:hypothetical protein BJ878DRAFT_167855 [Calycina marina]
MKLQNSKFPALLPSSGTLASGRASVSRENCQNSESSAMPLSSGRGSTSRANTVNWNKVCVEREELQEKNFPGLPTTLSKPKEERTVPKTKSLRIATGGTTKLRNPKAPSLNSTVDDDPFGIKNSPERTKNSPPRLVSFEDSPVKPHFHPDLEGLSASFSVAELEGLIISSTVPIFDFEAFEKRGQSDVKEVPAEGAPSSFLIDF